MSCEGSGRVVVTLKYYKNPSHRTYEFKCCDAGLFGCSGGCEAYFKICVTKSASANTHSCNMGTTQTAVIGNRDDHRLNLRKEFSFTSLQVSHKILRFCCLVHWQNLFCSMSKNIGKICQSWALWKVEKNCWRPSVNHIDVKIEQNLDLEIQPERKIGRHDSFFLSILSTDHHAESSIFTDWLPRKNQISSPSNRGF